MNNSSFKSVIDTIKGSLSIVDIVENFVSLKKSGKNYKGLCPFHDDKNPSMQVNDEKGLFHCFSCGAGGDIFAFLMRYNNISFFEAAVELAKRANVEIPKSKNYEEKPSSKSSHLYKINSYICSYYHKILTSEINAEGAREYLKSRGLNSDIAKEFRLGYAPADWDNLIKLGNSKNLELHYLDELGLVIRKENSKISGTNYYSDYYDRFRDRIMFPILDINGYIVGFGGRSINDDQQPKYLNSPESKIFQKRNQFYGLYYSKNEIRKKRTAILVEGYMDFISLFSSGVKNVVASLGTSLTKQHSMLLKRFCDEVIIVYDGDFSGINSAVRAGEIFLEEGVLSKISIIPNKRDPDSFIRKYGKEKFLELIDNAQKLQDIIIDNTYNKLQSEEISSKDATKTVVELISKIVDPIERSEYIKRASNRFSIRESDILSLIKTKKKVYSSTVIKDNENKNALEELILKILLKFPNLFVKIEEEISGYFVENKFKVIFTKIIENR
ncbi:MAG: DNA primase, partial [Thermodesulfobacteriota bacterium]